MHVRTPTALYAFGVLVTLAAAAGCGREDPDVVWDGQIVLENGSTFPVEYGVFADWESARHFIRPANTLLEPMELNDFRVVSGTSDRPDVVSFNLVNPVGEEDECVLPKQSDGSFRGPCVGGAVSGVSEFTIWPPGWESPDEPSSEE
ncbi:hypothetical protein RQM47_17015 [Rubrivirga sp. S365]|uniref:hypothetical protein n=1 Tax=Rubrivirga sp. S365 TaxID=3076080 RepID=UPI0028C69C4F|nr:hypothetical protein [Rubrivirga sp. S365]MDT7858353.1 hypothetical protein [Rubrivirga sp. S365]